MAFPRGVYLVADYATVPEPTRLLAIIGQAVAGGATAVQVRHKLARPGELAAFCRQALAITRPAGVPLIVNDDVEAALACGADGVHIGQGDMPYAQARAQLGPQALIGLSLEQPGQISQAHLPGLSYVAASPVFATPTKTDTLPELGLAGLALMARLSPVPVVAIGGIHAGNLADVIRHGTHAAAVVSAICLAPDPRAATQALAAIFASVAPQAYP